MVSSHSVKAHARQGQYRASAAPSKAPQSRTQQTLASAGNASVVGKPAAAPLSKQPHAKEPEPKDALLIGDIGATNCRLALYDLSLHQIIRTTTPSHEIQSLPLHIKEFLFTPDASGYRIRHAALAVAGPVSKDRTFCKFTNLSWIVDVHILKRELGFETVILINDFVAAAHGIERVPLFSQVTLSHVHDQAHSSLNPDLQVLFGPGTGLGMALLWRKEKGRFSPSPSEGGAVPLQVAKGPLLGFARYLSRRGKTLQMEDMLSGRGLVHLYEYAHHKPVFLHRRLARATRSVFSSHDPAAAVSRAAFEHHDPVAQDAVRMFVEALALFAQSSALMTMCCKIYIAGGIPAKILPEIERGFMHAFLRHATHKDILSGVEVVVITDTDVGLSGAASVLARYIQ